jgi:Nucleotidyltransferase domain
MDTIQQQLRQLLPELQQTYGITRLGIFGSYIRGEQTETSDLDLLVEFDPDRRFGLLTFCAIETISSFPAKSSVRYGLSTSSGFSKINRGRNTPYRMIW